MMLRPAQIMTVSAIALTAMSATAAAQTTIRFAHMNSPTHFVNAAAEAMAANVAERTGGAVNIEVYPSGQLGENAQITEQITLGGDLIGQVGVGTIADYVPDFSIIVYPFIYPDFPTMQTFLQSDLITGIEEQAEASNIKVLCYLHFGVRDLYTRNREVRTPEDSAGLSIRVQPVTIYTQMVEKVMNATPTPMPWPEVYSALAQGVIDAAEAPPSAILDQSHQEHARFLIQTNHMLDMSPLAISASLLQSLDPEHRQIVEEEANTACDAMSAASIASYEEGIETLREAGMTIIDDVDRAAFADRAGAIAEAFPEWSDGLYDRTIEAIAAASSAN